MLKLRLSKFLQRPEYIIAPLIILFGLTFMVFIKPLQVPDEANHFVRSYQVSQGQIFLEPNTASGCYAEFGDLSKRSNILQARLPKSIIEYTVINRDSYSIRSQLGTPLKQDVTQAACQRQTSANSPVGYIPQAFAIGVMRMFEASPILLNYAARIAILLTWTFFIFMAIKIIPVRKWTIGAIALLPLAVQQSISIGADVLSIAPAVLFVAIVVRSYFEDRSRFARKDLTVLVILATIAMLSKPVMVVLLLPLLVYRYNDKTISFSVMKIKKSHTTKALLVLVPLFAYLLWSIAASKNNLSVGDVFILADPKIDRLIDAPAETIGLFISQSWHYISHGFSFDQFGAFRWFNGSIPETWRFVGVACLAILLFVGYDTKKPLVQVGKNGLKRLDRALILAAIGVVAANMVTLYIIWTPLDAIGVEGVQFRYFLAAFFIAAAAAGAKSLRATESWYRSFVLIFVLVFFIVSTTTLAGVY